MKTVDRCPACGGTSFREFSLTVEAERNGDMQYGQTRCRDCDLVFTNPVAEADELERFYRTKYYEEHERVYNAYDPNLEQLVRDRARHEANGLKGSVLPYVSFDVVYSFQVIEHVSDLHEFVGGICRMLKPGGLTVIGTENHHNAWVAVRRARSWLKGRRVPEFQTGNHHTFYFSDQSLCRLAERHGLVVERCLVYTPTLAEKLPGYRFRRWYSRLAFYGLHYADVWTGRGGRVIVWCRKPRTTAAGPTPCWSS